LGRGRILADSPIGDVIAGARQGAVRVRTPDAERLERALAGPDVVVRTTEPGLLEVSGIGAAQVGEAALAAGVVLHELTPMSASLEEAYLAITQDEVEYRQRPATEEVR
jgi:ABC-2 type transport system ATP-binding protein